MFIGIDLGTSELKALLLDAQHRIVASVGEPLTVQQPQPLWREQDPADWWAACDRALQRLRDQHPAAMAQVQALGLSGQMHGAVLIDTVGMNQRDRRVALGTQLALAGGVSAALLFASGIGMIIGGRRRERARREALVVDAAPGGLRLRF